MSNESVLISGLQASIASLSSTLMPKVEAALKEANDAGRISNELKAQIDPLATELNQARQQLNDVQFKLGEAEKLFANIPSGLNAQAKGQSIGKMVAANEDLKLWAAGAGRQSSMASHRIEVQAAVTSFDGSGNQWTPSLDGGFPKPLNYRFGVRDLLDWVPTDEGGSVHFVRETSYTNAAAPAAENTQKGESNLVLTPDTAEIVTIAHFMLVSKQSLSDSKLLGGYIDGRLTQGLKLKEEEQLLKGSGVSGNIDGLMTQATAWANQGITVDNETALDRLRIALLQIEMEGMYGEGFVLNPADWTAIELLKDTTRQYLFANPFGQTIPMLWGLPVVSSVSQTQGQFLAGAFRQSATAYDREQMTIEVYNQDKDNVQKNMLTILCEERIGLAVHRPTGLVKGSLAAVAP